MEYFRLITNFDMFSFWAGAGAGFVASLLVLFVLGWVARHAKTVILISAVVSAVSLLLLAI